MEMTFSQLDAGDQKLLKLMQTIDYGRLEQFSICNGHVVATSTSRKVRSRKIGTRTIPHHQSRPDGDFLLNEKQTEFFNEIREVPEGYIKVIQIQAGLPISFEIEESISSI